MNKLYMTLDQNTPPMVNVFTCINILQLNQEMTDYMMT